MRLTRESPCDAKVRVGCESVADLLHSTASDTHRVLRPLAVTRAADPSTFLHVECWHGVWPPHPPLDLMNHEGGRVIVDGCMQGSLALDHLKRPRASPS